MKIDTLCRPKRANQTSPMDDSQMHHLVVQQMRQQTRIIRRKCSNPYYKKLANGSQPTISIERTKP